MARLTGRLSSNQMAQMNRLQALLKLPKPADALAAALTIAIEVTEATAHGEALLVLETQTGAAYYLRRSIPQEPDPIEQARIVLHRAGYFVSPCEIPGPQGNYYRWEIRSTVTAERVRWLSSDTYADAMKEGAKWASGH